MSTIFSSAFAPGGLFACGDNSGTVRLLGSSSAATVSVGHGPVYAICAPSDQALVCGGDDGISVIDSATHRVTGRLAPASSNTLGHSRQKADAETNALVSDAQSNVVYCCGGDGLGHAWDGRSLTYTATYRGHNSPLYCMDVCDTSNDRLLATGGEYGRVCLFDIRRPEAPLTSISTPSAYISSLRLSWPWILIGSSAETVSVYHAPSLQLSASLPQVGVPQAIHVHQDRIITAGSGGVIQTWTMGGVLEAGVKCHLTECWSLALPSSRAPLAPSLANAAVIATGACAEGSFVDVFEHIHVPPVAVPL